jgi:hypothetical protein
MLRPTRSWLVTEMDIGRARRGCNLLKTKSFHVHFVGIFAFAPGEAIADWLRLEPSPRLREGFHFFTKIAGCWRSFNRNRKTGRGVAYNQA